MGYKFVYMLILIILIQQSPVAGNEIEVKMKNRLPDILQPEKYEIDIYTDVMKPNFYGEVYITIKCHGKTNKIIMNENKLKIENVEVWLLTNEGEHDKPILVIHKDYRIKGDQFHMILNEDLEDNNRYAIKIKYSKSSKSEDEYGYLFLPYDESNVLYFARNIQYLAFTQMNDVEASRVFPCLDQIGMKAEFTIRHRHPATVKSFSNAKKSTTVDVDDPKGWIMDKFEDTESMSTFSVALVVANYESIGPANIIPTEAVSNIEIKIWAEKETLDKMKAVMETVMAIISRCYVYFSNYFKVPYKPNKLDLLVMPGINVDAQDSYGLIILRQNDILKTFDESNTNKAEKYAMFSKICYSMSRQWIGHSVTMSDWSETWLHYGLNGFLQKLCINEIFSDWKSYSERRLIESFVVLLKSEERGDYNPIVPLGSGSFFTPASDSPHTYVKIHLVIRMLSFILERKKDVFRKSLENYLKAFESGNTNVDKTWEFFTKAANDEDGNLLPEGITVKNIMDSWLGKKGHPHIIVNLDNKTNEITVTQESFNFSDIGKKKDGPTENKCWIIPLSYTTKEKMEFQTVRVQEWLKCDGKSVTIKNANAENWMLFNLQLRVPCRVTYEYPLWLSIQKSLLKAEEYSRFDFLTRIHLTSDMFALAEAEKLSYEFIFNTIDYLKHEDTYECWKVAISELNLIRLRWTGTDLHSSYMQLVRDTLRPVLKARILKGTILTIEKFLKTKPENDSLESIILMGACIFEAFECLQLALEIRNEWKLKTLGEYSKLIPSDLRESVFCLAAKNADEDDRDFLFEMYNWKKDANSHSNKIILNALGCSIKREILQRYLDMGMDLKNELSLEVRLRIFQSVSFNAEGYPIIMDYLTTNVEKLRRFLIGKRSVTIEDFLIKVIDVTKTVDDYIKIVSMLPSTRNNNSPIAKMIAESKSKAERNIQWLRKKQKYMVEYFMKRPESK